VTPSPDDPPPLLRTWNRLYALVLGVLLLEIVVFWLVTGAYA